MQLRLFLSLSVILEYLGGIETLLSVFLHIPHLLILEYLGGIETGQPSINLCNEVKILEYLGGIETLWMYLGYM